MDAQTAHLMPYLIPMLAIVFIVRRNLRAQTLRIERLWIAPALLLFVIGASLFANPPTDLITLIAMPIALAVGALAGWYRGRFTNITIDPTTHSFTSKASPIGMLLIAGLFAARYGLRFYLEQNDTGAHAALSASATSLTDGLLAFSVGMVCAQRLEMWLRARRLLASAMAGHRFGPISSDNP